MSEEIFFAPLAGRPVVTLNEVVACFSARGHRVRIDEHSPDMCWLVLEGFGSQMAISTSTDDERDVGLVAIELTENEGDELFVEVERVMATLGLSNDPGARCR